MPKRITENIPSSCSGHVPIDQVIYLYICKALAESVFQTTSSFAILSGPLVTTHVRDTIQENKERERSIGGRKSFQQMHLRVWSKLPHVLFVRDLNEIVRDE